MCTDQKKLSDSDKLRLLADWFDLPNPNYRILDWESTEVQDDLRRMADRMDEQLRLLISHCVYPWDNPYGIAGDDSGPPTIRPKHSWYGSPVLVIVIPIVIVVGLLLGGVWIWPPPN